MTDHAGIFHQLHRQGLLRLPNAWDAGSARLIESVGAPAIATTSAGMAWSYGYRDGDALPAAKLVETSRAIARTVRVPVSVDIEGGYSDQPAAVGDLVAALLDAGAVGINIEDGNRDPAELCARIEAVRTVAERAGIALFINARTDVFLRGIGEPAMRVDDVLLRASLYARAGASGLFVPGLHRPDDVREVVAGTTLPLNLMDWAGLPAPDELERLGVRRLSAGSSQAEALYARLAELAAEFTGQPLDATAAPLSYPAINALFPAGATGG